MLRSIALLAACLVSLTALTCAAADAVPTEKPCQVAAKKRHKVVLQVSDNDPAKWNLTLNNVKNVQSAVGAANADIEIVAYGPGINMIKFDSLAGERIREAIASGVRVIACENTMANAKLTKDDMLPSLAYVPAGVLQLMQRQQEGYAYIKP